MSYFVFDMDQTLAELHSVYYFIASLTLNPYPPAIPITDTMEKSLEKAYRLFVHRVLKEEESDRPLGVLRPGILQVMDTLQALKKQGKVISVMIYSNNSHLNSLLFVRDLIHAHVKSKRLIRDCIHWFHPRRSVDKLLYHDTYGQVSKSWGALKEVMSHRRSARAQAPDPADVYFFDDLVHSDLQKVLKRNYHRVPAYTYKAPFDRIALIFLSCVRDAAVNMDALGNILKSIYIDSTTIGQLRHGNITLMEDILDVFQINMGLTTAGEPPKPDRGIHMIQDAMMEVEQADQTGKVRRKRSQTHKKRRWTIRRNH
jgi:hypothetical protein